MVIQRLFRNLINIQDSDILIDNGEMPGAEYLNEIDLEDTKINKLQQFPT